ncbi:hypothetical protein MS3_00008297 [Schistosoma haematobium]|uniref:Uncharacterized protein n=2 Tax=Schistosoma haematobium TaxID=6185 RepID=A0A922LEL5_SCHHA|nr:hypothetical protein MS3_00008297 [Schistosoma haematobium]KAH9581047.1 hypothetical protein MS3_00008297 [Schistosoma haematobium]
MMKLALDSVSEINCQNNSNCTFHHYAEPVVLSGVILTFIGLLIGLAIILIKKLHSTSIMNTVFMVITHYVLDTSWISWWCAILIVIVYTAYYLCRSGKEEQSDVLYITFLRSYEYISLIVVSQFSLNSFIDCHWNSGNTE